MSIGRPLQYDPEQAISVAMGVFWVKGYANTSVDDLLDSMRLSKSSFYQAFSCKHDLFLQCVLYYLNQTSREFKRALQSAESGKDFIINIFDSAIEKDKKNPRGCLVSNTATEFAQSDADVSKLVKKSLLTYKRIFKKAIITGQRDGSIKKDIDPDQMAGFIMSCLNGLRTMVKAGMDKKTLMGMVRIVEKNL